VREKEKVINSERLGNRADFTETLLACNLARCEFIRKISVYNTYGIKKREEGSTREKEGERERREREGKERKGERERERERITIAA